MEWCRRSREAIQGMLRPLNSRNRGWAVREPPSDIRDEDQDCLPSLGQRLAKRPKIPPFNRRTLTAPVVMLFRKPNELSGLAV
jgi:hypothetical protein